MAAEPVALIAVVPKGESYGIDIESDLTEETLAAILRAAADQVEGKQDRASGAWGRS